MKSRGFTLIELLVVIAIIGILSSVVLASLTTARSRGTAAAVQNELSNMRAQAELYYSTNGNRYTATAGNCTTADLFTSSNGLASLLSGVNSKGATSVTCYASTTAWAVAATAGGNNYCVDSTGKSTSTASVTSVSATVMCP
ncbi:MAG TPA: type II secretion system protein [Candidatus Paceibacterota bacterium]